MKTWVVASGALAVFLGLLTGILGYFCPRFSCDIGLTHPKTSKMISWDYLKDGIEEILDKEFSSYLDKPVAEVSTSVTIDFNKLMLNYVFTKKPECQDTLLIDYTSSNFYNHLISYADGNVMLTVEATISDNSIPIPDTFMDSLHQLQDKLQEPVHKLLNKLQELEVQPAWEMTKELRGFMNSDAVAGMTYREAVLAATKMFITWFEKNTEVCTADGTTYRSIVDFMAPLTPEMSQAYTQAMIEKELGEHFSKMNSTDVAMINKDLTKAKFMRNLIWNKVHDAFAMGQGATGGAAPVSLATVMHAPAPNKR